MPNRHGGQQRPWQNGPNTRPSRRPGIEERLRSQDKVQYFTVGNDTQDGDKTRRPIRPDLLDDEAERVAKLMQDIPASQLRRFFGTVMDLKRRLEADPELRQKPEFIQAELAFLKASAAYTAKRLNYHRNERWQGDPLELVSFMTRHRNSVKSADDFEAFAKHFEAVMAFHKVYGRER